MGPLPAPLPSCSGPLLGSSQGGPSCSVARSQCHCHFEGLHFLILFSSLVLSCVLSMTLNCGWDKGHCHPGPSLLSSLHGQGSRPIPGPLGCAWSLHCAVTALRGLWPGLLPQPQVSSLSHDMSKLPCPHGAHGVHESTGRTLPGSSAPRLGLLSALGHRPVPAAPAGIRLLSRGRTGDTRDEEWLSMLPGCTLLCQGPGRNFRLVRAQLPW